MKRTYLYPLAFLSVLALGAGGYVAYAHNSLPKKVVHHIALNAKSADPSDLLIKVGEYVEFDSKDGKTHNIASGVGNGDGEKHSHEGGEAGQIESGEFAPDEGYLAQFKQVGTFYFHDHLNPDIHISVGVYDPTQK